MDKTTSLWSQIQQHGTHAPRHLVVDYIRLLAAKGRAATKADRETKGDYSDPRHTFPQSSGEQIANDITTVIAMQDWIDYMSADDLEEIGEISGALEITPNDSKLWNELFEKIDKLD